MKLLRHAPVLAVALALVGASCEREPCPPCPDAPARPAAEPGNAEAQPSPAEGPPVVGVSGYVVLPGEPGGGGLGRYAATRTYHDALARAGAVSVHLLPAPEEQVPAILDRIDALVLCGGPDIDPASYGEEPHPSVEILPEERQSFDFALAREAERRRMPILGICLGSQELSVVRGGAMIQDIPSEVEGDVGHRPGGIEQLRGEVHEVTFVPGTRLAELYEQASIRVNSAHHQAVDPIGERLRVAARAPDGVVEGFDDPSLPFFVGVQFHPEAQTSPPGLHDRLFEAFVEAAREHRQARR